MGRGSTFHFTAAFARPLMPAAPQPAADPGVLRGLRVLVVDDNATNRRILVDMLTAWHMRPTAVVDAASAIAELRSTARTPARYQLVISDGQMPDVDGFTLVRWIKQDRRLPRHPHRHAHVDGLRNGRANPTAGHRGVPDQTGQALRPVRCHRHAFPAGGQSESTEKS